MVKGKFIEVARNYSPWLAVLTGVVTLFSYAVLLRFPLPVKQAFGQEIIIYCVREAVFSLVGAVFLARVIFGLFGNKIFGVFRNLTALDLAALLRFFKKRRRRGLFRKIIAYRRALDLFYSKLLSNPNETSIFIASILYIYFGTRSWKLTLVALTILPIMFFRAFFVEMDINKRKLVPRFRGKVFSFERLKQFSYSTAVLMAAFICGVVESAKIIDRSALKVESEGVQFVVFTSELYTVEISSRDIRDCVWFIVPRTQSMAFKNES